MRIVAWITARAVIDQILTHRRPRLFHYLYRMMDAWSREIVGWDVHDVEDAAHAATLERLGVLASFSRPRVSNDNSFSESPFHTMNNRSEYPPQPVVDLAAARQWVSAFVRWYSTQHLHSAIRFVTPADRHAGRDVAILAARHAVSQQARAARPNEEKTEWPHDVSCDNGLPLVVTTQLADE